MEIENRSLKTRLETEKRVSAALNELNETRKSEAGALRATVVAKNETIAAKDNEIAARNELIHALKRKKASPWKRLGDVLLGIGLISILR